MQNEIQKAMSGYFPVSLQTAELLNKAASIVSFRQGDLLERENNTVNSEFIVLEGIVRGYIYNSKGDDITVNFYTNGKAITPAIMRGINNLSIYNLEIISDAARILVFNNTRMETLMPYNNELQQFGNTVVMMDCIKRSERELMLLKETAKGKLNWFRKIYPGLENEIPHYFIASYLGITPTSLSRIRGKS